jgi:hypothetical protein
MKDHFQLHDDVEIPHRWHLDEVRSGGSEPQLRTGIVQTDLAGPLTVDVSRVGRALDFSLTSFAVPIASAAIASEIARIPGPDLQCFPVKIGGQLGFEVLNVIRVVDCLDESRSEFIKWTEHDQRPDRLGRYRQVTRLHLDRARIPVDAHVFRVKGWLIAMIVSGAVKEAMERVGCLGAKFEPVD